MRCWTLAWVFIHALYVLVCMWGGPYLIYLYFDQCEIAKMTGWWLALMVGQFAHWWALKYECIFSLLEKRSEDPNYVMGSNPSKSHLWKTFSQLTCSYVSEEDWKNFHFEFTKMNILLGIGFLTIGNECYADAKIVKTIAFAVLSHAMSGYLNSKRNQNYRH